MNKVKIIADSCSSLTPSELKMLDVDFVQMSFVVNGEAYNAFDNDFDNPQEFYKMLEKTEKCSTSCVNTQTYLEKFSEYVNNGYDVVYIGLSGGMSSSINNAKLVAAELNKQNGEHVWVVDSLTGSFGIAMLINKAVGLRNNQKSAKQIFEELEEIKYKKLPIFVPGDLQFLMRSGRINRFVASIGSLLKISPILSADEQCVLKMVEKCLGYKKAIRSLQNMILSKADLDTAETIYIGHTGKEAEAKEFAEFLKGVTKNKEIKIGYIDYTMGCSCGPNTLAIFVSLKN